MSYRCHHKLPKLLTLVTRACAFWLSVGRAADQRTPSARKKHS